MHRPLVPLAALAIALLASPSLRAQSPASPAPSAPAAVPPAPPPGSPAAASSATSIDATQTPAPSPSAAPAASEAPPIVHVDAPPPARIDADAALVVVGDDGGLRLQEVRALRGLVVNELRKRGVPVIDDVRSEGIFAPEAAQRLMRELRVGRAFSIDVLGRLGEKVPLAVEELSPDRPTPRFSASLTAGSIEEADVVVPRLVDAVLERRSADENAELGTVTDQEARPFRKRPGELHWDFGLVIPTFAGDTTGSPFGFSTALFYELEHLNFGGQILYANNRDLTVGGLFFEGNWLPIDGEVSPYLGGGIGYMGTDVNGTGNGGLGLKVQVGVEALRLHRVRIMAGFEAIIPLYATGSGDGNGGSTGDRHFLPMAFLTFSL